MRKKIYSALAIAACIAPAASAQSSMQVYTGDNDAMTSFTLDDIASVKFSNEQMFINFRADEFVPFQFETRNVARIKFSSSTSAVNNLPTDIADQPAKYFNLQGIPVANPAKGNIYIRVRGNSTDKVVF